MPAVARTNTNLEKLTFEQALQKLESIVQAIEQGQVGLEESIQRYEEGMALIQRGRTILAHAEQRIQTLQLADDGTLTPEPFDPDTAVADHS